MKWNTDFWNMTTHPYTNLDESDMFDLLPYPPNESEMTKKELDHLVALIQMRTPETEAEIKSQLKIADFKYDCFQFKDLQDPKLKYMPEIINMISLDLVAVMMRQKRRFDRVRPTFLDKRLTTVIPVPEHPAYPSGHATETHVYAQIFSELNPDKKELYFNTAKRISENRELAGVHYPSDTRAGVALAGQFYRAFMKKEKFQALMKNAKVEFKKNFSCK